MPFERDLGYYQGTPGSRTYALRRTLPVAQQVGNQRVIDKVEIALDKYEVASRVNYRWEMTKTDDKQARRLASELDVRVDRTVSRVYSFVKSHADRKRGGSTPAVAKELLADVFPGGVFPITSARYEDELAHIEVVIEKLEANYASDFAALGITELVDDLKVYHSDFAEALDVTDQDRVTYDQVLEATEEAEAAFQKVTFVIYGEFCDDDATRRKLLEHIEDQDERTRRYFQRRGRAPAVDPETGEVVEGDIDADDSDDADDGEAEPEAT